MPVAQQGDRVSTPKLRLGVSNYHAIAGTHFFNKEGIGRMLPAEDLETQPDGRVVPARPYEGDGVLEFPGKQNRQVTTRGLRIIDVNDGISFTIAFAETIEPEFAHWLDGQETWLVSAWPSNPDIPTFRVPAKPNIVEWPDSQLPTNWVSLGRPNSAKPGGADLAYLPAQRWSGAKDRKWGPSSYHGCRVTHGFADGHTKMINDDIDKNLYLQLVTRNRRESPPADRRLFEININDNSR